MIDRAELDQWLREHDYALVTREQAARLDGAGVVPWDEHRRALAKADAELAELRARLAQFETAGRALLAEIDDPAGTEVSVDFASDEFHAALDGNATPAGREDPTDA